MAFESEGRVLTLDVLIATHNRPALLERAIRSVLAADPVVGLEVTVTVVANHCTAETRDRVAAVQSEAPRRVCFIEEPCLGKSKALNTGIAATSGELVGFIDDDEEVDPAWLRVASDALSDPTVEFVGGPYVVRWDVPVPPWMPNDYLAVIGASDSGPVARDYSADFPGILKGGNAVIRRTTLMRVGPFAEDLGPSAFGRLLSCEDEDMYHRLLACGARGQYRPDLIIYHHLFKDRLRQTYYRRWSFWRGVSRGTMDRRHPLPVRYLAGVPRFLIGDAARAVGNLARRAVAARPPSDNFADELRLWDLAGYVCGKGLDASRRLLRMGAPVTPPGVVGGAAADP
jgi:glycosyltransferase involved in cell wall biosynthesis